ncbi:MAG: interleukin-like EMT inducer domain-containing protein, partial [Candidatus Omnitrophica bacterium]|nr:interleukin-like EMT inducer domain-containing protein [Candidatus Omnitrophota bacterium]
MADFIGSVEEGDYVVMAIGDDGRINMTDRAFEAIESIGSGIIRDITFRGSWAIIGRKGAEIGSAIEGYNPSGSGPVVLSSYTKEHTYYDKDLKPISLADFYSIKDINWYSVRPTQVTDEIEIITHNVSGAACGYIKNYNFEYPNSGFIRLWEHDTRIYDEEEVRFTGERKIIEDEKIQMINDLVKDRKYKAVYFDSWYKSTEWMGEENSIKIKDELEALGYEVIDAIGLREWMQKYGNDSVVVMARDIFPSTVHNIQSTDMTVREYMDKGGTVVWMYDIPFYYVGGKKNMPGSMKEVGESGQKNILGLIRVIEKRVSHIDEFYRSVTTIEKYTDGNTAFDADIIADGQQPLDSMLIFFDFSANYVDIDWHKIKASIGYELEADTPVVSEYDGDGNLLSIAKADKTVSVYKSSKLKYIMDIHGEIIVEYIYDKEHDGPMDEPELGYIEDDANIIQVILRQARYNANLKIQQAQDNVAREKASQLEALAVQKGLLIEGILESYDTAIAQTIAQKEALTRAKQELDGKEFFWWWEKSSKAKQLQLYSDQIRQCEDNLRTLYNGKADKLAEINTEIASSKLEIEQSADSAFSEIDIERLKILEQISLAEIEPVVINHYRDILGRDPGEGEIAFWIDRVKQTQDFVLNITELRNSLTNSTEFIQRTSKANKIRGEIEDWLNAYIHLSNDEKTNILNDLSLNLSQTAAFSQEDLDLIYAWLADQNVHFGRSATNILGTLFTDAGIAYNDEDVLKKAILIDILTGSINKFTQGLLRISMFSLSKIAGMYGLDFTPVQIDFDQLQDFVSRNGKAVAFIGDDHYVIVTNIDIENDTVSYIETSKGENGEVIEVSISEFNHSWINGYAAVVEQPQDASIKLTEYQSMKVRGACFFALFSAIAAIFSAVFTVIQAIVAVVVFIVQSIIVPIVQFAFNIFANFVGALWHGLQTIGSQLLAGIQHIGTTFFNGIGNFFTNAFGMGTTVQASAFGGGVGMGMGGGVGATAGVSFATTVMNTVVNTVVSYGINMGLQALGVDPIITQFISSFTTGNILGATNVSSFFSLQNVFDGLKTFAITATEMLLPGSSNVASLLTNLLSGVGTTDWVMLLQNPLGGFIDIAKDYWYDIANLGVGALLDVCGIDGKLSSFIGSALSTSLGAGLNLGFGGSGFDIGGFVQGLWNGAVNGVTNAAVSFAINYAVEEFDLPPLLGQIGGQVLGSIANVLVKNATQLFGKMLASFNNNVLTTGNKPDKNDSKYWKNGVLDLDLYASDMADWSWQEDGYKKMAQSLSDHIANNGFENSMNMYKGSMFESSFV